MIRQTRDVLVELCWGVTRLGVEAPSSVPIGLQAVDAKNVTRAGSFGARPSLLGLWVEGLEGCARG